MENSDLYYTLKGLDRAFTKQVLSGHFNGRLALKKFYDLAKRAAHVMKVKPNKKTLIFTAARLASWWWKQKTRNQ